MMSSGPRKQLLRVELTHIKSGFKLSNVPLDESRFLFKLRYTEPNNHYCFPKELFAKKTHSDFQEVVKDIKAMLKNSKVIKKLENLLDPYFQRQ